jgi:hypothetical protein
MLSEGVTAKHIIVSLLESSPHQLCNAGSCN